jgi:hypothetical protein
MPVIMPPVRQRVSPNYSPVLIRHDLTVIHRTEGGYAGSTSWLCNPVANASAHRVMKIDGSEVSQLVPMSMKAWHAMAFNGRSISLEIEGFTSQGIHDATLNAAALIAAWDCVAYAIPPIWAKGGQGRGVAQHIDLGAAGGNHHDCSPIGDATWTRMMSAIQNAYAELKKLPSLPVFALHGLPGPQEVVSTPDVAPTPSHNGAARNEPGDMIAHPTPSRYPLHSIAALQATLNNFGQTPVLDVDGWFGAQTQAALRAFQITHGLVGDGLIGPISWQALDAAMAKAA